MSELDVELVTAPERLAALKPEWDLLMESVEDPCVFMSHSWYDSWWSHYAGNATLHLLVLRKSGAVVGIAPLMRHTRFLHGVPVREIGFIANGNSLHNDLLLRKMEREEAVDVLCGHLFRDKGGWDLLCFHHMPKDSPNIPALVARLEQNGGCRVSPSYDSPYLEVAGGWERFHGQRSQRVRKTLRNIVNTLHRTGKVEVREVTDWEGFLEAREGILAVAKKSWTERVGDSLARPANAAFFEELARRGADTRMLSLWLLLLEGRIIAFEFHLRGFGKQHALRASFDEEFRQLSPGTYLEAEILKRLFDEERGIAHFDFGGSFNEYKKRWSDRSLDHMTLSVFNDGLYSKTVAFHEAVVVDTARRLRDWLRRRHGNS